jgi:large subunit ribosomal protein L40
MSSLLSIRGLASRLLRPFSAAPLQTTAVRALTTTTTLHAPKPTKKQASGGKGSVKVKGSNRGTGAPTLKRGSKKDRAPAQDPKVVNLLRFLASLSPKRIPPPLRMARNRHLRHWTIHRGWLLFRRKQREEREGNLMKQHQAMSRACEELRLTAGPGTRPEGYLFRVAMEKKGVYGLNGVPIEYARAQTDTPARVAWNHDWKA